MPTGELLRIGLEESDGDRGAFGDDGEEMAARESEEKGVRFTDGGVAAGLFVEERFVAKVVACVKFREEAALLIKDLNCPFGDEIDPVGNLAGSENFFLSVIVILVEFLSDGEENFEVELAEETRFFQKEGFFNETFHVSSNS